MIDRQNLQKGQESVERTISPQLKRRTQIIRLKVNF
jgi:hypothetical protein